MGVHSNKDAMLCISYARRALLGTGCWNVNLRACYLISMGGEPF